MSVARSSLNAQKVIGVEAGGRFGAKAASFLRLLPASQRLGPLPAQGHPRRRRHARVRGVAAGTAAGRST